MAKNPDSSRREFLSNTGKIVVGEALLALPPDSNAQSREGRAAPSSQTVPKSQRPITEFFFGASVYPELQTRQEWNAMLDHLQRAQMNCVRVSGSSWGNIEVAAGRYEFEWLEHFLDNLEKQKMRAILGDRVVRSSSMAGRGTSRDPHPASPRDQGASDGPSRALPYPPDLPRYRRRLPEAPAFVDRRNCCGTYAWFHPYRFSTDMLLMARRSFGAKLVEFVA